jgi:hypothetical protein
MTDERIERIERGIARMRGHDRNAPCIAAALADLRAWQEVAERHPAEPDYDCTGCGNVTPCPDRQAADAALDRLDALWGTDAGPDAELTSAPCTCRNSNPAIYQHASWCESRG